MELQLGLAQPIGTSIIKGFDLNFCVYEPKEDVGSNTLNQFCSIMSSTETNDKYNKRKRSSFREAFELNKAGAPTTLPLLLWNNNQPNDEDDHKDKDVEKDSSFTTIKNDNGDGGAVVGWPPVKNLRKRLRNFNPCDRSANNRTTTTMMMKNNTSKYVKVKMEGDGIARKIDLSRYFSYQTLSDTLIAMFNDKFEENVNKDYNLTYQDTEGDWLLAGDVPWRTFIRSAQRLRLLRKSG